MEGGSSGWQAVGKVVCDYRFSERPIRQVVGWRGRAVQVSTKMLGEEAAELHL